jgi:dynein heavy chain
MTCALQTHARKYRIPIDTLNFGFRMTKMEGEDDVVEGPEDGIYVNGLFLDGARWDRKNMFLATSMPGKTLTC